MVLEKNAQTNERGLLGEKPMRHKTSVTFVA